MKSFRLLPMKYSFRLTTKRSIERSIAREARIAASPDKIVEVDGVSIDTDRRAFLKLAGIAGLGVVASQMLPGKASAYVMGSTPTSNVVGVKDSSNTRIDPAKEGGNLATIATNTTKIGTLTFDGSNNLLVNAATGFSSQLENASGTIINPAKEDGNLATVATNTANIGNMTFSGGALVTTSSGGGASIVGVKDVMSIQINPASDDSILYLRRLVKLMESQATVDTANRQKITIDSITGSLTLSTITTVSTVTAVTGITNALPAGTNALGSVTGIGSLDARQWYQDVAHTAYATATRMNLVNT